MNWRKSRHSNPNGACVEVGGDYRKSTRSANNGACVEVASGVRVRDTTDRSGPELTFAPAAWAAFTAAIKILP